MTTDSFTGDFAFSQAAPRRVRAFAQARRHTRLVRVLRLAVPAVAVAMSVTFVLAVVFDARAPLTVTADSDTLGVTGAAVTMERPRLTGYSNDNRAYEVNAGRAEQSLTEPSRIELVELNARLQIREDGWADIVAAAGRFDSDAQSLMLDEDVQITTDRGDRATLGEANVDLRTGRVVSPEPVQIAVGNADLSADSMEVLDNGDRMLFEGRVVMTLRPTSQGAPASGETPAAPPAEPPVR